MELRAREGSPHGLLKAVTALTIVCTACAGGGDRAAPRAAMTPRTPAPAGDAIAPVLPTIRIDRAARLMPGRRFRAHSIFDRIARAVEDPRGWRVGPTPRSGFSIEPATGADRVGVKIADRGPGPGKGSKVTKVSDVSPSSNVPIPASGAYWGIYRDPAAYTGVSTMLEREQVITEAEAALGRKFNYDRQFYKWGDDPFAADPTPNAYLKWSSAIAGHTMDINLVAANRQGGFTPWADIANGSQDAYLRRLGADIKAWGRPAFFTFQHEPEPLICPGDLPCGPSAKYYGTTTDYKAAWRHLVAVFRAVGVANLSYVWQTGSYRWNYPSDYRFGPNNYPGGDVIDWIAVDPFNSGSPNWQNLADMITPWYAWASRQGKPLMLGAFGCVEQPGNALGRADWFTQARTDLRQRFPEVKALMYFDHNPSGTPSDDWRLFDGNSASLSAYRAWGLDDYFDPRVAPARSA